VRIKLTFISQKDILLPVSNNQLLQALIYTHIDDKLAHFLHDHGFVAGGRHFKLFTFSRIQGKVRFLKDTKAFQIASPFSFIVSSPVENFIQSLAENLVKSEKIELHNQQIFLESISVYFMPRPNPETIVTMLSPMTMYSTFAKPDGRKVTHYYTPFEKEFSHLLSENLKKKYKLIYKKQPDSLSVSIEPIKVSRNSEKIVKYKGTVIKGWMGEYKITGSPELISVAYDTGLGSKNPQGFGCFEIET
jgi:CRISPR-associated endoribonuclease Cas6